ncbi:aminotransferase class III-fold pyridoxal phosphate-dependent enzyme [Cryobacterium sinapicolor]|uniref:Aminotransferase class III-fold pyridoxal phosphate-dependent enzyme n=1 Tax=Cryobacterium sinapicolor TaxID=1259236 RepID=A0ABY2J3G7_9MICO|nr:aminotransferase class III-fold pyridoxal phosphate-dependent enzyme [Cryobacterium sinapicolor]TFC99475.1 aminotransferase class III-fold pyridoxal phosphate-dependent enzyme [Cryobacterium sinapicolor]
MPGFDFFSGQGLVRPDITAADAESMAASLFGLEGTARELGSQQDRNFLISTRSGAGAEAGTDHPAGSSAQRYVLKVDNPAFSATELAAQDAVMEFLAERGMQVPKPVRGLNGASRQQWQATDAARLPVRLLTFLEGPSLEAQGYLAPPVVRALGRLSGTTALHLHDFAAEGLDRTLQWDLRNAKAVIDLLVHWVPAEETREQLRAIADSAAARLATVIPTLRLQTIHGDITDDNVICRVLSNGHHLPEGVIDFGDLGTGWLVAELAVTVASVLHHLPDNPLAALGAIVAFDEVVPLTDDEIVALWPLIVLRGAVLVASGEQQVQIDAHNDYARHRMDAEWRVFAAASAIGWEEAEAAIRQALGRGALGRDALGRDAPDRGAPDRNVPAEAIVPMIPALMGGDYEMLDFSVTSPALADGLWQQTDAELQLTSAALARRSAAVAPYGQFRLTRTEPLARREPDTFALFTEVFLAAESEIVAPAHAVVAEVGPDSLVLTLAAGELRIGGITSSLSPGISVAAGVLLGVARPILDTHNSDTQNSDTQKSDTQNRITPSTGTPDRNTPTSDTPVARVTVQEVARPGLLPPHFTRGSLAVAWAAMAPDPARLLGLAPQASVADPATELTRRGAVMAAAQEKYYERPPQIERGWRDLLIDTRGRSYVDMVNNVAVIGHSHPRFTRAVSDQLALLNTNSRFLYSALADLCERIVEKSPDPSLDTVLLVNSGSEAVDLALRLARIHTGRGNVVALREGYHGWTMASDAVSTSAFDNPYAAASRPGWVHIADVPNAYRGTHRGAGAAAEYAADLARLLDDPSGPGVDLAAFISEPVLGNAGGIVPPAGYLSRVYEHIRARGGLCIADEVQVGYGRLGSHFWGSAQQGVVPDIITVAKAMGNGYPLGAVLTRRDIAESLAREGNFFSSAGGSPVSCVAGLAVLDVIRDEALQQNADAVGRHLAGRLAELAARHPMIGKVHGMGLYQGVELVRDRDTREPATSETAAICERMLELGVIVQPASERQNVLKIKPPLCLSRESADFFVDRLDEVLQGGW